MDAILTIMRTQTFPLETATCPHCRHTRVLYGLPK